MEDISKRLKRLANINLVKNEKKLRIQQDYYKRLEEKGIAKKQSYNLKAISSI